MSTISLRLSDSLHEQVKLMAARDKVSINQFVATALAEKLSALLTEEYLGARAARGNRAAYDEVLGRVAEAPPPPGDAWPPDPAGKG
ncbi:MAG: toxin-antitoxin system HicB family antitoxin [Candidatus Delongbacteria bacterium]